jgi:hypothetical protein
MYTIDHNVKVFHFGTVHPSHQGRLRSQWIKAVTEGDVIRSSSLTNLSAIGGGHGGDAEDDDDDGYDDGYEEPKPPGPTDLRRTDAG